MRLVWQFHRNFFFPFFRVILGIFIFSIPFNNTFSNRVENLFGNLFVIDVDSFFYSGTPSAITFKTLLAMFLRIYQEIFCIFQETTLGIFFFNLLAYYLAVYLKTLSLIPVEIYSTISLVIVQQILRII